jgi:hypothetical protein
MISLEQVKNKHLIINKVGNSSKNEGYFLSKEELIINEFQEELLLKLLQKGLKADDEIYKFSHATDIQMNEVYALSVKYFEEQYSFMEYSTALSKVLYAASDHPKIKQGELLIMHVNDIVVEDELVDGIFILKCEEKRKYMHFEDRSNMLIPFFQDGVSLNKIDKGCLILNSQKEDGFRVLAVDGNVNESKYWHNRFLKLTEVDPSRFYTENTIAFVERFVNDVIMPDEDPTSNVTLMNKSIEYLESQDRFNVDDFVAEVLPTPAYQEQFLQKHESFKQDLGLEDLGDFEIYSNQVEKVKKKNKKNIQLDNGIQIQLGFSTVDLNTIIEKGFDESKKMSYYKIFYQKEEEY